MDYEAPELRETDDAGTSRRDFLKKAGIAAGTAAWAVPTMQVLNMASAGAQVAGSPPGDRVCVEYATFRVKWDVDDQAWEASPGEGANDCLKTGDTPANGGDYLMGSANGDSGNFMVKGGKDCEIVAIAAKAGLTCVPGSIGAGGQSASVSKADGGPGLSHVEIIIRCCVRYATV